MHYSAHRYASAVFLTRSGGLAIVAATLLVLVPGRFSSAQDWWRPYRSAESDDQAAPLLQPDSTAGILDEEAGEQGEATQQSPWNDDYLGTSRISDEGPLFTAQNSEPPPPPSDEPSDEPEQTQNQDQQQTEEPQTIGQAPEDVRQFFLQRATPLLRPGQTAIDYGFEYLWRERTGPTILPGGILATARVRARQIIVPTAMRYGYSERLQLFLNVPFGLAHQEFATAARDTVTRVFGAGDLRAGFNYLLRQEEGDSPSVIGTFSFTAPIAADPYELSPGSAALGNGFWALSGSLLLVKSYDPIVVFGGAGYRHQFDRDFLGFEIDPGETIFYNFGVGFAANDYMTLSTTLLGAYQSNFKLDGVSASNSSQEPISIRLALTHTKSRCLIIEPFVRFGLTDDAANADFGIIWTRRY